jgi:hypothetical protein
MQILLNRYMEMPVPVQSMTVSVCRYRSRVLMDFEPAHLIAGAGRVLMTENSQDMVKGHA